MSNSGHSGGATHRSFRCTFGPVREVDLVWPPPDEDMDAFSVVHLDGSDASPPLDEPAPPAPPAPAIAVTVIAAPVPFEPRTFKPTFGDCRAAGLAPRVRPFVVPMERPPEAAPVADVPAPVEDEPAIDVVLTAHEIPSPIPLPMCATAAADPEASAAGRSAWLAVMFAAACALLTFIEYREFASMPSDASEAPPVPPQVSVANEPQLVARAARPPASPKPAAPKPAPSKPAPPERIAAAVSTRPTPTPTRPAPAPTRPDPTPMPRLAAVSAPVVALPPPTLMARVETPPASTPAPLPAAAATPAPEPEPIAKVASSSPMVATPVPAVLDDSANDEAGIRSTLTRFRTAYSQLDASAARDVWPSVDARALERAFQSLKSQDLRFESCKMTVTGARAQAACKGRTVYVPRIGDQSPRHTSRDWNFELRKADERWTIASARSL